MTAISTWSEDVMIMLPSIMTKSPQSLSEGARIILLFLDKTLNSAISSVKQGVNISDCRE